MKTQSIQIELIRRDGGTQPRAEIDAEVVEQYRERMQEGDSFPPVDVFFDGTDYWLADGFHRVGASEAAEFLTVECRVHQGSKEDAQWFSYGANSTHDKAGLRRTNADKQRAVQAALRHPKAPSQSDQQLADHVGVSRVTILNHRKQMEATCQIDKSVTRTGKDGRTTNTANIGRKPAPEKPAVESEKTVINTETGEVIQDAAVVTVKTEKVAPTKPRGQGLDYAYKAIAILQDIPLNDGLRQEAFDRVVAWIEHNRN